MRNIEQFSAVIEVLLPITVRQKAIVANADEAAGQRMHEEAANEFGGGQRLADAV